VVSGTENTKILTALDLWAHLFADSRGLLQIFTGKRITAGKRDLEGTRSRYFDYPAEAGDASKWALEESDRGREAYYCAHLLTKKRRVKENASPLLTLYVDGDGAEPRGHKPTASVRSSPGRAQYFWRLDSEVPPELGENLNKRLAYEMGADKSGWDLTQLLRVPGTVNHKYEERPVVEVVSVSSTERYSPAELDCLLPEIEEAREEYAPEDGGEEEPPVVLSPEALKVWRGEAPKYREDNGKLDRSASLLKIGRALYDAGANRRLVVEGIKQRDIALGWRCYADRPDAEKRYAEIFGELEKSGRNGHVSVVGSRRESEPEFPKVDEAAYRGLFGKIVELVDPHTEGSRVAVLGNALTYFGNALGRGPYMQVGATKHRPNLFTALVGKTAKGRKGSASDPVEDIMRVADVAWGAHRIVSGLSSGEGLINEVRDPLEAPDKDGNMKVVDPGVSDKRLLVAEGELSQALKVMKREGNTLSPVLRNAWDGKTLRTLVKHSPLKATDPHISILGHVTEADLTRHLTETEMANGLANRILWLLVQRSKSLPFGGAWHTVNVAQISTEVRSALEYGGREFRLRWADDAKPLWAEAYELLTEERPGMFGAITARAEAQTLRLAMIYALADRSDEIHRTHVKSALAVWEFAEESARAIFGDLVGDHAADKLLQALKAAEDGSMPRNDIRQFFGRNLGAKELDRIRALLLTEGRIRVTKSRESGSKKPTERWHAA